MTIVVGCIGSCLALLLASLGARIGDVSHARMQAQTAADAAALAAVAESAPYGRGAHELQARRYAALNGASLVECLCTAGATAVQVEVAVEGVSARARAVIEPELFRPALPVLDPRGLDARMLAALIPLLREAAGAVHVVSGFRSAAEQEVLWAGALRRYGTAERADDWVAPPGSSMHELGLAVDLGGDLELAVRLIDSLNLPLHRPLVHEPWHFELSPSPGPAAAHR